MQNSPSLLDPCSPPIAVDSVTANADPLAVAVPVYADEVIDFAGLATGQGVAALALASAADTAGLVTAQGSSAWTAAESAAMAGLATGSGSSQFALAIAATTAGLATPAGAAQVALALVIDVLGATVAQGVSTLTAAEVAALAGLATAAGASGMLTALVIDAAGLAVADAQIVLLTMAERTIDLDGLAVATLSADMTLGALPAPQDLGLPMHQGSGNRRLSVPWRRYVPAQKKALDDAEVQLQERTIAMVGYARASGGGEATLATESNGAGLAHAYGRAALELHLSDDVLALILLEAA